MDKYIHEDYSGCIEIFESLIEDDNIIACDKAILYTNIAAAELGLEMARKCIKTCQIALGIDPICLRAYVIQGKALLLQGHTMKAIDCWKMGLQCISDRHNIDIYLISDLKSLIRTHSCSEAQKIKPVLLSTTSIPVSKPHEKEEIINVSSNNIINKIDYMDEDIVHNNELCLEIDSLDDDDLPPLRAANDIILPMSSSISYVNTIEEEISKLNVEQTATSKDDKCITSLDKKVNIDSNDANNNVNITTNTSNKPSKKKKKSAKQKDTSSSNASSSVISNTSTINNKDMLCTMYENLIGSGNKLVNPLFLSAVRNNLSHKSGEEKVDDLIAYGYLQVNTGKLDNACEAFTRLLLYRRDLPAAYLGLGSAQAMRGKYDEAIKAFSGAISIDVTIGDAWKRRGQTKFAKGLIADALADLTKASELCDDPDTYNQRALIYHQIKNYKRALIDFRLANKGGMCEGQLGNIKLSIEAHEAAFRIEPSFKEAIINRAQMFKEIGVYEEAFKGYEHALSADSTRKFTQVFSYKAILYYALGNPILAEEQANIAMTTMASGADVSSLGLAAVCCQSVGNYNKAIAYYNRALEIEISSSLWFQKEVALYLWGKLKSPLNSFSIDNEIDPRIKDGWCKRAAWRSYMSLQTNGNSRYVPLEMPIVILDDSGIDTEKKNTFKKLLSYTLPLTNIMQLNSPGFIPNKRQRTMFGITVLQMAQTLRSHLMSVKIGGPGLEVNDIVSSKDYSDNSNDDSNSNSNKSSNKSSNDTSSSSSKRGVLKSHSFSWRDFFDIVVKWRQISEPNDPVWWIDRLPAKAFKDGFGLQTPIVNGQLKTIRYYSYFPMALEKTKKLMEEGYFNAGGVYEVLKHSDKKKLASMTTLEEIHGLTGKDFYVIIPCPSIRVPELSYEGTRLTCVTHVPEGYEFTIRTPGTPVRWESYNKELESSFNRVVDALIIDSTCKGELGDVRADIVVVDDTSAGTNLGINSKHEVLLKGLELFYYWVTFAPLSRGTAVCGYAALSAVVLAAGYSIEHALPKGKQLDWEAILADDFNSFAEVAVPMLELKTCSLPIDEINISNTITNIEDMINFLMI